MSDAKCESRELKHNAICNSLDSLERQISRLEEVIDKIKGHDGTKSMADSPSCQPCLSDFMEQTPSRVSDCTERIDSFMSQLNQAIF